MLEIIKSKEEKEKKGEKKESRAGEGEELQLLQHPGSSSPRSLWNCRDV